jgi:hypothetical protein
MIAPERQAQPSRRCQGGIEGSGDREKLTCRFNGVCSLRELYTSLVVYGPHVRIEPSRTGTLMRRFWDGNDSRGEHAG